MSRAGEPQRFSFELERSVANKLNTQIPWGMKGMLMARLAEMMADVLERQETEEGRLTIIAAILDKSLSLAKKRAK